MVGSTPKHFQVGLQKAVVLNEDICFMCTLYGNVAPMFDVVVFDDYLEELFIFQ